ASRTTQQISRIIKQAENDSAALFKATDNGGASTAGGAATSGAQTGASGGGQSGGGSGGSGPASAPSATRSRSSLENKIREMLGDQCPADPTPLLTAIQNASPAERQAVLNNPELMNMIYMGL